MLTRRQQIGQSQQDDLDQLNAHNLKRKPSASRYPKAITVKRPHIFRRSRLQIDSPAEQLIQNWHDAILLVQRRQTSQEPQQELEGPPVAGIQRFLAHRARTTQHFLRDIGLLIIGVQYRASHERDLKRLLDNAAEQISVPILAIQPLLFSMCQSHIQFHNDRPKCVPHVFIVPMLGGKLRNVDGGFLGVARRPAVNVVRNVEEAALDPRARRSFRAMALVAVIAFVIIVL